MEVAARAARGRGPLREGEEDDQGHDHQAHGGVVANFWQNSAKCCSFSAVSAPIFASKYAFCSIFQNLPDYLAEFFEIKFWQILGKMLLGTDLCKQIRVLQHFSKSTRLSS